MERVMNIPKLPFLFKPLTIVLLGPALMAPLANSAHGQLFKSTMVEDLNQSGFFVIVTREGRGPSGVIGLFASTDSSDQTTTCHFGMRDENGYQYETLDQIKPPVVEEIELSQEQVDVISEIKREACADLADMIADSKRKFAEAPSGLTSVADIERSYKKSLEDRFYTALDDIKATLDEDQLSRLEQIKHHNGIKQLGLAKYLGSSRFNGLASDEDAKSLEQMAVEYERLSKANALELLKAANKKLLGELTSEQQKQYSEEFGADFTEALVGTAMFTRAYSAKKKIAKRKTNLYRILKVKKVRTSIGLSENEYSAIKKLDDKHRDQLSEKLLPPQRRKLAEKVVLRDLHRMGTVNSLTCGYLRDILEIDDEQAEKLSAVGKKINAELIDQIHSMKKEAFQEATSVLSVSLQQSLEKMLGEYAIELPEIE